MTTSAINRSNPISIFGLWSFFLFYCLCFSSDEVRLSDCNHGRVAAGGVQLQDDGGLTVPVEMVSPLRAHVAVNTHTQRLLTHTCTLHSKTF